jgi:hypothetical protein
MNGLYFNTDFTYTASLNAPRRITSPVDGSVFTSTSVTFQWQDVGASEYGLYVGTTPGSADLYYTPGLGTSTSTTVGSLPSNGIPLYVKLFAYIDGEWVNDDYVYTAYTDPVSPQPPLDIDSAEMLTPVDGAIFGSTSATFEWEDVGAYYYNLYVGTYSGGWNIAYKTIYSGTSITIDNLPADGSPVYVKLKTTVKRTPDGYPTMAGYEQYTYTAFDGQ